QVSECPIRIRQPVGAVRVAPNPTEPLIPMVRGFCAGFIDADGWLWVVMVDRMIDILPVKARPQRVIARAEVSAVIRPGVVIDLEAADGASELRIADDDAGDIHRIIFVSRGSGPATADKDGVFAAIDDDRHRLSITQPRAKQRGGRLPSLPTILWRLRIMKLPAIDVIVKDGSRRGITFLNVGG